MTYTPEDIVEYIFENNLEADFMQAVMLHKGNFSIGEITDKRFKITHAGVRFFSKAYDLNVPVEDMEVYTAVHNELYVSAFISRFEDKYELHFLVHSYPVSMKERFEENILKEVLQYMIMMTVIKLKLDTPKKAEEYAKIG